MVHLKDMAIGEDRTQVMAEVGEGNLNWPAILDAGRDAGVEWCAGEQDICQRGPSRAVTESSGREDPSRSELSGPDANCGCRGV